MSTLLLEKNSLKFYGIHARALFMGDTSAISEVMLNDKKLE
jgi:hypothetical protein